MCRLLGFSAKNSSTLPKLLGQDLDNFVALSQKHCDGWERIKNRFIYDEEDMAGITIIKAAVI